MRKLFHRFLKIYAEFQIKSLHFIMENTLAYITYIFILTYSLYGPSSGIFRILLFIMIIYFVLSSLILHLFCKNKRLRKILRDLVTESFITKYLGH